MKADQLRTLGILLILFGSLAAPNRAGARDFRTTQYPNGTVLGCAACHVSPFGGGARTAFGQRVFQIIGGSSSRVPFWSAALAAEDSDGDSFCNGQEVGDPDGDGTAIPGAPVSNPGVRTSRPANSRPGFVSAPVLQAVMGLPYRYQASATNEACQTLTFAKLEGPAWLSVSADGLASGTPPEGLGGDFTVVLQVWDNGQPTAQTNLQTYTLSVVASFEGWQALKFNLPTEASLAGPSSDADGDGIINGLEYAFRTDPRVPNVVSLPTPSFNAQQQLQTRLVLRDDDPRLTARMVVADTVRFSPFLVVNGEVSDPLPGDGLRTWTFVDPVVRTDAISRFGRILIEW